MHLIPDPFQPPNKMNPRVRREMVARDGNGYPDFVQGIPNVPLVSLIDIALRAPRPPRSTECLIHNELQGLRSISVVHVEIEVVRKVAYAIAAAQGEFCC